MRWISWIGALAALVLVVACFMPWVYVDSRSFTVTGVAAGDYLKKPGYSHFVFVALFLLLTFIPKIWAKRINLIVVALNLAWAVRNYFVVSACSGGECPAKKLGLYLVVFSSVIMLVASFFPNVKIQREQP